MMYRVTRMGSPVEKSVYTIQKGKEHVAMIYDGYHGSLSFKLAKKAANHLAEWLNEQPEEGDGANDQIMANAMASAGYKSEGDPDREGKEESA